jgi:uncharacterized protein (TIRG00374 family)
VPAAAHPSRIRKALGLLLRFGIAGGILVFLLHKIGLGDAWDALQAAFDRWPWLLAAHLVMLLPLLACAWRWKVILDHLGMAMSWPQALAVFFIGQFFNGFMLGATGGDVIKAYYAARQTHHKRPEAIMSIAVDRIVGLYAIVFIVAAAVLARYAYFLENPALRPVAIFVLASAFGGAIGLLAISRRNPLEYLPWLRNARPDSRLGRARHTLHRAYLAFQTIHADRGVLLKTVALSALNQLTAVLGWVFTGLALGLTLSAWEYVAFALLIGYLGSVPITPGGVGVREGACIHVLGAVGVPAEQAFLLSFLPYLSLLIWGLPGGVLFLFYAGRKAVTPPPAPARTGASPDRAPPC